MVDQGYDYAQEFFSEINSRIKDIEEKQRVLKERLLLIGQNLIEMREEQNQKILNIKLEIEKIKNGMSRMLSFLEIASREFPKFAKKEDLEILKKQAKMFQPLEFIRKSDLKKLKLGV